MKISTKLRLLPIVIYLILVIILFLMVFHAKVSPIRGEHWMLIRQGLESKSFSEFIRSVSGFAFPGIQRPQWLAFYLPYFSAVFFGTHFEGNLLINLALHSFAGGLLIILGRRLGYRLELCLSIATLWLFNYVVIDTITWTFFSYYQIFLILILLALICLHKSLNESGSKNRLLLYNLLLMSAYFLEVGVAFIICFGCFEFMMTRDLKKFILPVLCIFIWIVSLLVVYHGFPNQQDANRIPHPLILYRSLVVFLNTQVMAGGFIPIDTDVFNVATIHFDPITMFRNFYNYILLTFFLFFIIMKAKNFRRIFQKSHCYYFLLLGISGVYILVIVFARIAPDQGDNITYSERQFRYYYLLAAFLPLIFFKFLETQNPYHRWLARVFLAFILIGQFVNLSSYFDTMKPFWEVTRRTIESIPPQKNSDEFFLNYITQWKRKSFNVPDTQRDFIYNTADFF